MSRITMQDVAVMSVQYVQYSFAYYLDSMKRCGLSNIDMWGGAPHYCRLDYNSSATAHRILPCEAGRWITCRQPWRMRCNSAQTKCF